MSKAKVVRKPETALKPNGGSPILKILVPLGVVVVLIAAASLFWLAGEEQTPDFQLLKGQWLRPDGGYILDFKQIDSDGRIEAAYLNPNPINVEIARVKSRGKELEVYVELRDRNYPGSTYTLTYFPDRDLMEGIYFQAAMRQSFQVIFIRQEQQ